MLRVLSSLPVSVGCYYVAENNYEWERQLDYRHWYYAHEEYRRALKLLSKLQANQMSLATKDVEENLYRFDSPQLLIRAVTDVRSSYSGINTEMAQDTHTNQAVTSKSLPHSAMGEAETLKLDDVLSALNTDTTVEDRVEIVRLHVGLKHEYQAFAIAMASSKEAMARDKMLTTLHEKPFTLITDDEKWYMWNTRYLFWISLWSGLGGVTWIAICEKESMKKVFQALFMN